MGRYNHLPDTGPNKLARLEDITVTTVTVSPPMRLMLNLAKMLEELEGLHPTVRVMLSYHTLGIIIEVSWMRGAPVENLCKYRQLITKSYMENSKDVYGEEIFNHLVKRIREKLPQTLKDQNHD